MSLRLRLFLPTLLIGGIFVAGAAAESAKIRIEGNRFEEKVALRPLQKAPTPAAGVVVVRAEFSESSEVGIEAPGHQGAASEIRVYAQEYFNQGESRQFRSSMPGGARPSDIRYGSGEQRSDIRYGSGEQRSDIRYGSGEQRSEIRYGSGEPRSDIKYSVTGGARNVAPYGGTARQ